MQSIIIFLFTILQITYCIKQKQNKIIHKTKYLHDNIQQRFTQKPLSLSSVGQGVSHNPWMDIQKNFTLHWQEDKIRNTMSYNSSIDKKEMIDPNQERLGPQQFVPKKEEGIMLGSTYESNFELELFLDLLDPKSKQSLDTLLDVTRKNYLNDVKVPKFKIIVNLFPQSKNRYSWILSLAARYFEQFGQEAQQRYITMIFKHQDEFSNQVTNKLTLEQVQQKLLELCWQEFEGVSWFDTIKGQSGKNMLDGMQSDGLFQKVRISFRYAVMKKVWKTPTYYANEVRCQQCDNFTPEEWVTFLDKYVKNSSQSKTLNFLKKKP